jgi:Uma2 family endonuclease
MTPTVAAPLMTAEEFVRQYADERVELVNGRVEEMPMPSTRHGRICLLIARLIDEFAEAYGLGRAMSNDSFIKTREGPDSVRGPDISYYSFERLPKGQVPEGLLPVSPDLVVEVRSQSDNWPKLIRKANEYLNADVRVAVIVDPEAVAITVLRAAELPQVFDNGDDLVIPDVLPGFTVPVRRIFE